jgi:hypothetical protein
MVKRGSAGHLFTVFYIVAFSSSENMEYNARMINGADVQGSGLGIV